MGGVQVEMNWNFPVEVNVWHFSHGKNLWEMKKESVLIFLQDFKLDWDIVQTTNIIHIGHTSELQWYFMDKIMVMKVIVVWDTRDLKSLGLQGLAGSTPARGT